MLDSNTYLVKEHVAALKLTDVYDIVDPSTGRAVAVAKEEPETWAKWARLAVEKRMLPTRVRVYEAPADGNPASPPGALLFGIEKPWSFLRPEVKVRDAQGADVGFFKAKLFSIGGGFLVHRPDGSQLADVSGDWKGWNFTFKGSEGAELGVVTKKWAGLGKELFTSADTYVVDLKAGSRDAATRTLLLAAALAVDIIYKEGQ